MEKDTNNEMSENTDFPKTEKIELRLRQDLADRLPKEKGERNTFINQAVENELEKPEKLSRAGKTITPAKSAAARENGKKGGRPKMLMDSFSVSAMKNGEMYELMLVPMHVLGRGEKAQYRFVVCHSGGGQTDAEHQPVNDGGLPDIQLLAEENGFEVLDIYDFMPKKQKQ